MKKLIDVRVYIILLALLVIQGCVAVQSFPTIARAGDTITLSVGSADGMTKSNTILTFTPTVDGEPVGTPIDISSGIRSIIKLNPDETSALSLFQAGNVQVLEWDALHGAWLSVIVLDLPDESVLPVGEGIIDVDTTASYSQFSSVAGVSIGVEILPGIGESNSFSYDSFGNAATGQLSMFEPLPQVVVRPVAAFDSLTSSFAAAEIKLDVPIRWISNNTPISDAKIRIVSDKSTRSRAKQTQMFWSREGDEITVNFISPEGTMRLREARFSIVLRALSPESSLLEFIPPLEGIVVNSFKMFNVDGVETVGNPMAFNVSIE